MSDNDSTGCSLCVINHRAFPPDVLWRYVKPSWLDSTGGLLSVCFDLRSEMDPPEDYVSFYEGGGSSESEKLSSIVKIMTDKKFTLKQKGRILSLQVQAVCDVVNSPNTVIEFVDKGRPHYGLCYLVDDEALILEAKNILALSVELHEYSDLLSA